MKNIRAINLFGGFLLIFIFIVRYASAQSGGAFIIEKSVIGPGGIVAGGAFSIQGVAAQPAAGDANGGQFALSGGFITPQFVPTAASVSISGRVLTLGGNGIRNVFVVVTDMNGNQRTARTGSFGYFRFDDVEVGQTYLFNVKSRRYQFSPRVVAVNEEIGELSFTALSEP